MVDKIDTKRANAAVNDIQGGIQYANVPAYQDANFDSRADWIPLLNYHGEQTRVKQEDDPALREELNKRVARVFGEPSTAAAVPLRKSSPSADPSSSNKVQSWVSGCIREVEGTCGDVANWKQLPGSTVVEKCRHILKSRQRRKYLLVVGLILIAIILLIIIIFSSQ